MARPAPEPINGLICLGLGLLLALLPTASPAKDLSAETLGVIHDLMSPYRGDSRPALGENANPEAVAVALDILRQEKLIDFAAPPSRPSGIAERLGRALAMGQRTAEFLPEIGQIHDALLHQEAELAGQRIGALYQKMGRTPPDKAGLAPLIDAAAKVVGDRPQETERVTIERPAYTVLVENAKAAGKAMISVLTRNGPGGEPARIEFKGDVRTEPDPNGRDLVTRVTPANTPETMTSAQALELRARINGNWRDQDDVEYVISGTGNAITVTELRPGKTDRPYLGTFDLGLIRARFAISRPGDIGESLPLKVREQLAGMGIGFNLVLSASEGGAKLEGTWSSNHVTYGSDQVVEKVHDPYDLAMILTRGDQSLAEGAAPGAEP